jgi:hypothetical protein
MSVLLVREAERMTAVRTNVFRIATAPGKKSNPVRPEETLHGMTDDRRRSRGFEKAVAAVARVFDEAVARRHRLNPVAEDSARVPDFLREPFAVCEAIVACRIDERVPAPDAHVLVHPAPIGKPHVRVMPQEAR